MGTLELQPGDLYAGHIRVLGLLGTGTFATVYKVRVPNYPVPLALKLSRESIAGPDEAQRALREVTILRALTNPHVCRTFDCGLRPDGHVYMLMDYLDGDTLDAWHRFDKPLHAAQAVTIVHQACLGLAEAHAKGIVHRDIKPENIFVERNGQIKVLDFGLARSWDGSPVVGVNATDVHMVVGTPHYSQPEQLHTRVLSPASDVYSLALILYELLSGHSPFHANRSLEEVKEAYLDAPSAWLKCHAENDVTPIRQHAGCANLPDALVSGLARALAKSPRDRPPDAGALANMLGLILHKDMQVPVAGTLKILHPDHTLEDRTFLPGSYKIGCGDRCEIMLRGGNVLRVHAVLEWSGMPNRPQLRPITGDGSVRINGVGIHKAAELGPDDEFSVDAYELAVSL
ncbi:MAG: FHA domain-containing serine/threonine-protein kinase [Nannocystaceae bacterium]